MKSIFKKNNKSQTITVPRPPVSFGKTLRSYAIITLGLVTYTMGWTCFIIPLEVSAGGATGIGSLVYYVSKIPVGYTFLAVNVILILIAMKLVGASFGVKTIYGVAVASVFLRIEQYFITQPMLPDDPLLSTIIGGALSGLGIAITFGQGGSTGGTDIIAMIVTTYRNVSPGRVILATDSIIIGSAFFILQNMTLTERFESIVYGCIVMTVTSYTIDTYLQGLKQSLQILIFSQKYDRIADRITQELHRGVTIVDGKGWYSKNEVKVTITMVRKSELGMLYRIVKSEDPDAFTSVANAMGVYGRGFERIKS